MSRTIAVSEDIYRKFQAALMLSRDSEEAVLNSLIIQYANNVFERAMKSTPAKQEEQSLPETVSAHEQRTLFINWFRSLTRNGRAYNPVTISGYTGRIETACEDSAFSAIPIKNLFEITSLSEFLLIQSQIKACSGYADFDAKSHNGFTAALKKYEEFLRYRASGNAQMPTTPYQPYTPTSNHRWTIEEDTICCRRFLECYVIQKSNMEITQFLSLLAKEVPNISEGSLRMKIQNVKYLTVMAGIRDTSTIKWLSQYSMQCAKAFQQTLNVLNIQHGQP